MRQFARGLLDTHDIVDGRLVKKTSPAPKAAPGVAKKPPAGAPKRGVRPAREPKATFTGIPEIDALYAEAEAVLALYGYKAHSNNELKWKHWIHHLRERGATGSQVLSAIWKIPLGGQPPAILTPETKVRRRLAFVRYGGRALDRENLCAGLKSVRDELVDRGLLWDDDQVWLDDSEWQVPGGEPRLEILFLPLRNIQAATIPA